METLGQFLKREREFRGITLEQLKRLTRISKSILSVLEDDLPVPTQQTIYMRSMLKNYARGLGLNEDEILARFQSERGKPLPPTDPVIQTTHRRQEDNSRVLFVILIIAACVAFVAYWASR